MSLDRKLTEQKEALIWRNCVEADGDLRQTIQQISLNVCGFGYLGTCKYQRKGVSVKLLNGKEMYICDYKKVL